MKPFYALLTMLFMVASALAQNSPRFSGLMFGDYYYNIKNHDPAQNDMQAFDYRRIYLTADYDISNGFTSRFRFESDPGASTLQNGKLSVMIKDAYLDWKSLIENGHIIFGVQGTWNINLTEAIFGYRSLEKTIQDLHGISSSRDMGISISKNFSPLFSAGVLVGNNSGNGLWTNRYKRGYLYIQYKPVKEMTILIDGDYAGAPSNKYLRTGDIVLAYTNNSYSIGLQAYMQSKDHSQTDGSTMSSYGISLNGWARLVDNLRLVARFDHWDPNTKISNDSQNLIIVAFDYTISNNVHIMPNLETTTYAGMKSDVSLRGTFYFTF